MTLESYAVELLNGVLMQIAQIDSLQNAQDAD